VDEFHYLGELGLFEGRGAKLIDGEIVEEGPMNHPHAIALELAMISLQVAFGPGWRMRPQLPLVLGQTTDPMPDLAVVGGDPRTATAHPTTAALVVEITDTTFRYDTTTKLAFYAASGIADYWVLDVNARQLHVFRDPAGDTYATHLTLAETDTASPLAAPTSSVRVADLLP